MPRILIGVSGGIAAYKALELTRLAIKAGHSVRVLMTPTAHKFVGAASFEGITGAPVLTGEFDHDPSRGSFPGDPAPGHDPIGHLEVVANADAYIVAPASANTIAKLASGQADSMLTTSFLACTAPRLVAPAMNDRMYRDQATQANLTTLRERGISVIEPEDGALASRGEHGVGRLPDPAELLRQIEAVLPSAPGPWDGLRVLVSAGGTREPIDAVRFIGNRSSGRMGFALAAAAARRGAEVTLVAANVTLPDPPGVRRIDVETTSELAAALEEEFAAADALIMAAAPADFRPAQRSEGKLARDGDLELRLEQTDDILASLAAIRRDGQTLIGFAAETSNAGSSASYPLGHRRPGPAEGLARARLKLEQKGVDAIVFNDVSNEAIGFDSAQNEVTIIEREGDHHVPITSKDEIAEAICERIDVLRAACTSS